MIAKKGKTNYNMTMKVKKTKNTKAKTKGNYILRTRRSNRY